MRALKSAQALAVLRATLVVSLLGIQTALAGPPFRTDDPVPVAYGHYELYTAAIGTHVKRDTSGGLPRRRAHLRANSQRPATNRRRACLR
jgi:hypothetical protein